ncbi:hypothetical protein [Rossellomorea sp. BNER]|uniref:hypothetical protein n=1 Tax=Rossellomorea sp. BNER TaxID=2962031 RepID=UPI003AF215BD|nr:hypothetical protein [Rossellomorea sp. BNER]
MDDFYGVFIVAGVLAVQYFFSTRNSIYWGAVIPVSYIVFLTWMLVTNRIESTIGFILSLLLGILFLIAEWNGGRKYLHKKRRKELDKMKTHDMK